MTRVATESDRPDKRAAVDAVTRAAAVRFEFHQPGLDQDFQVLRDGGLREVEFLNDIAAAAGFFARQMPENLYPRRMRERGEARGQAARAGFGHDEKFGAYDNSSFIGDRR